MFKSKSFTAAFITLSLLIVVLLGVLLYLVIGKISNDRKVASTSTAAPSGVTYSVDGNTTAEPTAPNEATTASTTTEVPTTTAETTPAGSHGKGLSDGTLRALSSNETHEYPIMNEVISCSGTLTVDVNTGLVFHKKAALDGKSTEGNKVEYAGTFSVKGKIYIFDDENNPYLMYQTSDGYYVSGNPSFVNYQEDQPTCTPDSKRVCTYGMDESSQVAIKVFWEDGSHVVFSVYNLENGTLSPVLTHLVGTYESSGIATFEYHQADDYIYHGTIAFEKVSDQTYSRVVDLRFDSPISLKAGERDSIVLHN